MIRILWKIRNRILRMGRTVLCRAFRFDPWHISPLTERPYARDIITYLNRRRDHETQCLVEIGCGLGDMIRRVRFGTRWGLDADARVLKAARFLSRFGRNRSIRWHKFIFPQTPLSGRYDVIILVNWIHNVPPEVLKAQLAVYFDRHLKAGGEVLIDTVQDKAYKYNHSVHELTAGLDCEILRIGEYERQREIFAVRRGQK